jgi:hypothetical protein
MLADFMKLGGSTATLVECTLGQVFKRRQMPHLTAQPSVNQGPRLAAWQRAQAKNYVHDGVTWPLC